MKDQLAEQLLAKVMGWKSPEEFVRDGIPLQAMATYKYDEYQQFSPGMRFIESLAQWLGQFDTLEQRKTALAFVRERLVFISSAEMNHLVSISYPDHIRPLLLSKAAAEAGLPKWHLAKVASSLEYRARKRKCLFLGLSDGSHTDVFRRSNPQLSNEQVRQSHELTKDRIDDLREDLRKDLKKLVGREATEEECVFRSVVLLDDFSASGVSYIRKKEDGTIGGKVGRFLNSLHDATNPLSGLFVKANLEIILVLYMGTQRAETVLRKNLNESCAKCGQEAHVLVVQPFPEAHRVVAGMLPDFDALIESHYDDANESTSTELGGTI